MNRRIVVIMSSIGILLGSAGLAFANSSIGTNISTSAGGTITSDGLITSNGGLNAAGGAIDLTPIGDNASINLSTGNGFDVNGAGPTNIGNNLGSVAVDSTTWDISTAGVLSGLTGLTSTGGATISGATINLNDSSNFAVNIATGTSAGGITIGNVNNTLSLTNVSASGNIDLSGGNLVGTTIFYADGSSVDSNKTAFVVTDPSGNRTITFPNASGTVVLSGGDGSFSTLSSTGVTTIGNGSATVDINASDWSVSSGSATFTGFNSTGFIILNNGVVPGSTGIIFDGATTLDGNTTRFSITDPTGTNTITFPNANGTVTLDGVPGSLADNTASALSIHEGSNNYLSVRTSNTTENMTFGNAVTNPTYTFPSSGTLEIDGNVNIYGFTTRVTDIDVSNHITNAGSSAASSGGGSCSGGVPVISGTDLRGTITADCTTGQTAVVTFFSSYNSPAHCAVTPTSANAVTGAIYITSTSGALTLHATASTGGSATWSYVCVE